MTLAALIFVFLPMSAMAAPSAIVLECPLNEGVYVKLHLPAKAKSPAEVYVTLPEMMAYSEFFRRESLLIDYRPGTKPDGQTVAADARGMTGPDELIATVASLPASVRRDKDGVLRFRAKVSAYIANDAYEESKEVETDCSLSGK